MLCRSLHAILLGSLLGCTRSNPPVADECRPGILAEGTEIRGGVTRVSRPGATVVRLLDQTWRIRRSNRRPPRASVERRGPRALQRWEVVETPLGFRRRSGVWKTPVDRAGTLVIEVAREAMESVDVTIVPSGATLNEIEQFHRTVRLDFPPSEGPTHEFEIALTPLLRGTWRDDEYSRSTHFQVELDAAMPVDAIKRVEVRPNIAKYERTGAPTIAGPDGALRPAFHLRSGGAWIVPVEASNEVRKLVFHLHAPLGAPQLSVRAPSRSFASGPLEPSSSGWARHELRLPAGPQGELRFEVGGSGVVLIGDPTLAGPAPDPRPPDAILYMVDTLLGSRVGALGNPVRAVSPTMDRLVDEGLTFVRAISTSPWTKPAIASLMTGVYPLTHRIGTRNYTDRLPDRVPLLQERFRAAGFRTMSASASPLGSTMSGLERGFDMAHPPSRWAAAIGPLGHPEARQIQRSLFEFIDEDPTRPVFGYVHTLEVHEHERPMFENGPSGETPYDRAVRYQDDALRELLDEYRRRKRDLILVLLSDHGEGFGEYGIEVGHGYSLRQNQLHIPLVFHGPEWLPRGRSTQPASIVDVAPTLLDLFSLPPLPQAQGRSLLPDTLDRKPASAVYAERTWFLWDHEGPALVARVAADGSKLVQGHPRPLSWELATSPCEDDRHQRPVRPEAAADLRQFVESQRRAQSWWEAAYGTSTPGTLDPGDVARLRALGYLQ